MVQELGETRDAMAAGCMKYVEDYVSKMKHETEPYYLVYCARENNMNLGEIRQTIKAYRQKPPALIGVLVWYVDNKLGLMEFRPDLSAPWDIPSNPETLSDKSEDKFIRVMERGQQLKILTS